MADQLIVKLGADTSAFKGAITEAEQSVQGALGSGAGDSAGGKFVGAFEHRLLGARHLSGALATALGLNIEKIGENFARVLLDFSKDYEEAIKKVAELSEQTTALIEKGFEKRRSETQNLVHDEDEVNKNLRERDAILNEQAARKKKIFETDSDSSAILIKQDENAYNKELVRLAELDKRNAELSNSIDAGKKKVHDDEQKRIKEDYDDVIAGEKMEKDARDKASQEDLDWYKKRTRAEQELHDLKYKGLTPDKQLEQLLAEQLAIQQKITKEKITGDDTLSDEIKLQKVSNDIADKKLSIEKETTKEIKEQNKEKMNPSGDLGVAKAIGGIKISPDAGRQYDYDQALIASATRDTQREIDTLKKQIDTYQSGGAGIGKFELPSLQGRLKALQGRQSHIQDYVFNPRYQDAAGQGLFASQVSTIGDPLKLQAQTNDTLKTVAKGVTDLNERLRLAGFGTGG